MADENTPSKADLDKLQAQVADLATKLEAAEGKNAGLLDDLKKAQRELRAAKDITPEAHQAEIDRADKAEAELSKLRADLKTAQTAADKATKALETEQGAARAYAIDAEINGAIADGNIVPALVPAFKAWASQGAAAELVDGKYSVKIGDKAARDHIKALLDSDDGKHFRAAPNNGGGGATGGGGQGGGKTITRQQYDADPVAGMKAVKEGATVVDAAA